jgi:flagellar basal-body rod modification protein FlgD
MVDLTSAIASASQMQSGTGRAGSDARTIAGNFDTFLTLLTTQLKNQDPSNPLDTNQFTQQLIQYTEVEQLLRSNQHLENLVGLAGAGASVAMIGFVGKQVSIAGNESHLADGGAAQWSLDVPANAENVTYIIKDAQGNEVYSSTGSLEAGSRSFAWDGQTSSGTTASEGNYTLSVIARNEAGANVNIGISTSGLVDGVDMTGESPVLLMNGRRINLAQVREIHNQQL